MRADSQWLGGFRVSGFGTESLAFFGSASQVSLVLRSGASGRLSGEVWALCLSLRQGLDFLMQQRWFCNLNPKPETLNPKP